MTFLSCLPAREAVAVAAAKAAYFVALEGVSRFALETASKAIIRGVLGHGFFPSPPELRLQCDEVMRPIREAEIRDREDRRIRQGMNRDAKRVELTPAEKQRMNDLWQGTKAKMYAEDPKRREDTVEASRARLEALGGDGCLDKIPNAPSSTTFETPKPVIPAKAPKPHTEVDDEIPW
ncbi:hypothetical protein JQC79_10520 [Ochrobactrum anthropi]|uniref:hypothetical protein n=1 Tax=Brucella anthropi TaxID=529 RepID=UPI0019526A6F|nr:hypothetical protein [Brucella anthropi]MBM6396183.1 hypothetical protein [Brucella anthropi]